MSIIEFIKSEVEGNDVVLFMKGTSLMPLCGFSGVVVQILKLLSVEFKDINVLDNQELRSALKEFSNWPTIPQLYIKGEFIGGCDIVKGMYTNKELHKLLENKGVKFSNT
ncbi:Grx4 family monothiol glutaredoxin [Candidatus Cyrtobacter comes]|uniref:Glutaredoxin n=1 Tax=Candidatus Cyrtobacter comes TaxID=675776 RepID=A0ABU5L7B9_9RICK|nr:Grx4 family monothiol glutaredoxin [Candidatus Cyrtobacter comes]MDZ5762021.1 Grx4 family monothiol glutaredoxin [Candidatus Cyrtobacter comes]